MDAAATLDFQVLNSVIFNGYSKTNTVIDRFMKLCLHIVT